MIILVNKHYFESIHSDGIHDPFIHLSVSIQVSKPLFTKMLMHISITNTGAY